MPDNVSSSRFKVPKSPLRNIYQITKWLGCDFTSSPSAVDEYHSQDCVNFTRYMPGKIRKRMGYECIAESIDGDIVHAIWKWNDDCYLVHVGTKLCYVPRDTSTKLFDFTVINEEYDNLVFDQDTGYPLVLPDKELAFIKLNEYGLIFGSGTIGYVDIDDDYSNAFYFSPAASVNWYYYYTPTVTISKRPKGGGTSYEAFNLLSPNFCESFYVSSSEATETEFQLSKDNLRSIISVEVLQPEGWWLRIFEYNGDSLIPPVGDNWYVADLSEGKITFHNAPGASPVEGEDNVKITACAIDLIDSYEKLANCKFGTAYGVNGSLDRCFLSGNPDYPNYDWYSQKDDPTYFPDTGYSVLGNDSSAIKGYAIVSNYLVTIKGSATDSQVAIIRQGVVDSDGNVIFQQVKSLQGYPILSHKTSIMAGIEPLFLSQEGIMAITSDDISGEQLMNSRSYYLNGKLMKESGLENSFAIRHGDFYLLFVNSHVYVLDTLQPITTENAPYSSREYASFYWDNIPASCAASIDGAVYFGTADGQIMRSYTSVNSIGSYSDYDATAEDHKKAIYCKYDTADLDALIFFKLKTYRYFALKVFSSVASSVKIYCYRNGEWELLKDDAGTVRYFTFSQLVFSKLTFRTDLGTRIVNSKIRLKKLDHAKFRIENDGLEESLMIDEFGIEFTQSGNYKN